MGAQGEGLGHCMGQGVLQGVKEENTGFGNARLGEWDQQQEANTWKHQRSLSVRCHRITETHTLLSAKATSHAISHRRSSTSV